MQKPLSNQPGKPDPGKAIVIANLVVLMTSADAIEVKGLTINHMAFQGIIENTNNGYVTISGKTDASFQLCIPVSEVGKIDLVVPGVSDQVVVDLLNHHELLPLWNSHIQESLVQHMENLSRSREWAESYRIATILEKALSDPELIDRIHILKAWALYEMGLHTQSKSVIGEHDTNRETSADYSTRYCWLRMKHALLDGDLETATYWALIPALRIPCDTSELAIELYEECESWQKES